MSNIQPILGHVT